MNVYRARTREEYGTRTYRTINVVATGDEVALAWLRKNALINDTELVEFCLLEADVTQIVPSLSARATD